MVSLALYMAIFQYKESFDTNAEVLLSTGFVMARSRKESLLIVLLYTALIAGL